MKPPSRRPHVVDNLVVWTDEHFTIFDQALEVAKVNDRQGVHSLLIQMEDHPEVQLKIIQRWLFAGRAGDQSMSDWLSVIAERMVKDRRPTTGPSREEMIERLVEDVPAWSTEELLEYARDNLRMSLERMPDEDVADMYQKLEDD